MKKKKIIKINLDKASIIGIVLSIIFAILCSFGGAAILIDQGFGEERITILNLFFLLLPLFIILFGTVLFTFLLILSSFSKEVDK